MKILTLEQIEKAASDGSMTPEAIVTYIAKHKSSIVNMTLRALKRIQIGEQLQTTDWKAYNEKNKLQREKYLSKRKLTKK
jgi:hypothetical protein